VPLTASEVVVDVVGNQTLRDLHSRLIPLMEAYLLLPTSAAECERGVSVMKLVKIDGAGK
jgi:hypothetical protein